MKSITLWQPWASLFAIGVKGPETRSWSTRYRGPLAIHAAMRDPRKSEHRIGEWNVLSKQEPHYWSIFRLRPLAPNDPSDIGVYRETHSLPLGAVVATCTLDDVVPTEFCEFEEDVYEPHGWYWNGARLIIAERCRPFGDYSHGRFVWLPKNIIALDRPAPANGRQGFWEWTP
jgi:hypothetical protein